MGTLKTTTELRDRILAGDVARSDDDPFQFIEAVSRERLGSVLAGFDSTEIALLAVFRGREEVLKVMSLLPAPVRRQTVVHVLRLDRIPAPFVRELAERFASRLSFACGIEPKVKYTESIEDHDSYSAAVDASLEGIRIRGELERSSVLNFVRNEAPWLLESLREALDGEERGVPIDAGRERHAVSDV